MTILQQAILKAIKMHNTEREGLEGFNKSIKLISTEQDAKRGAHGDTYHYEYPNKDKDDWEKCNKVDDAFLRLTVKCSFKPEHKYDNNVVIYEVMLISNGEICIYFDGTEYRA